MNRKSFKNNPVTNQPEQPKPQIKSYRHFASGFMIPKASLMLEIQALCAGAALLMFAKGQT